MDFTPLPFRATLEQYEAQAKDLKAAHQSGDPDAIDIIHKKHPRFLDTRIPWLPKDLPDSEIRDATFDLADAQLVVARRYDFLDWEALMAWVDAVTDDGPVFLFESAVEAVIAGDATVLQTLLRGHPELVAARSTRMTHFDPPAHRATLLHYVGANGVEGYRQKTPPNADEIARILLHAGAEVDALADLYGGHWTTMGLLVSSCHPAEAGVQITLAETLLDFGAAIEGVNVSKWGSPLMTALIFGYRGTAEALARRGARVDNLAAAAGLGRLADAAQLLPQADAASRHAALSLAAQHGHVDVVRLLLDAGEDPDRYNPQAHHPHTTPLHQAVLAGHEEVVRLLVERGARLDIKDTIYHGTPLGWAIHAGQSEIEKYLRTRGAE
jgi:hypothetical protein